jgi:hypothetical protein
MTYGAARPRLQSGAIGCNTDDRLEIHRFYDAVQLPFMRHCVDAQYVQLKILRS